jgi:hypothetical protein
MYCPTEQDTQTRSFSDNWVTSLWWRRATGFFVLFSATAMLAALNLRGAPLFLDFSGRTASAEPLRFYPAQKIELTFALTASAVIEPQLRADLLASAQSLAAPLATDIPLQLHRDSPARPGMQRFSFALNLPAITRRQTFVLRSRVRTADTESWLPLPVVTLEAVPETWRASLRAFADRVPCGRLAPNEKVGQIFSLSEAKVKVAADTPAGEEQVRVWFVEDEPDPAAGDMQRTVWVVFKADVPGGMVVKRTGSYRIMTILVDAGVLATLDSDPASQETFERVLTTAEALAPASIQQN